MSDKPLSFEAVIGSAVEGELPATDEGEWIIPRDTMAILIRDDGLVQIANPRNGPDGIGFLHAAQAAFLQMMKRIMLNPEILNELLNEFSAEHGAPENFTDIEFTPMPVTKKEVN